MTIFFKKKLEAKLPIFIITLGETRQCQNYYWFEKEW